jgi:hypothetical protein
MFTVDQSLGVLIFSDLTVTGFTSPQNSFNSTSIDGSQYPSDSSILLRFQNASGYILIFTIVFSPPDLTGSNLVHFDGGTIVSGSFSDGLVASGLTGDISPATAPLPAAFPLFASGLGVFLAKRRKRRNAAIAGA